MSKTLASVWICGITIVVLAITASAQSETCATLSNGGFESGSFAGWTTTAGPSVIGPYQDRNYLPAVFPVSPFGRFQALLTAGPASAATVETFLGVTPGFFTGQRMTGGAAIKKSFAANAGDIISCSFYWSGQDVAGVGSGGSFGAPFNDTAYLTITQSLASTSAVFTLADIASGGNGHDYSVPFLGSHPGKGQGSSSYAIGPGLFDKGYKTFAWVLPSTQTYTIGFVSFNQTDNSFPSDLLVDNCVCNPIKVEVVPVGPSTPRPQQN